MTEEEKENGTMLLINSIVKEKSGGVGLNELIESYKFNQQQKSRKIEKAWLTKKEVCEILGCSRWKVDRLIKAKKLKSIKLSQEQPGAVRISVESLNAYIESLTSNRKECA